MSTFQTCSDVYFTGFLKNSVIKIYIFSHENLRDGKCNANIKKQILTVTIHN